MNSQTIPYGYCQCGCGGLTSISPTTHTKRGYRAGEPRRFISGHNGAHRPAEPLEQRYTVEDRGHGSPCWIWQRTISNKGYAVIWDPTRQRLTQGSRYFYEFYVGPIPPGLQIDHLCRVRACVNPTHLEPVTQEVNQRRGANAKLTDAMRTEMLVLRDQGWPLNRIAKRYGVSWPTIDNAIRRSQH